MSIKKLTRGSSVIIISGKYKGEITRVSKIINRRCRSCNRCFVELDSIFVKRCLSKNASRSGSIVKKKLLIDVSNVVLHVE